MAKPTLTPKQQRFIEHYIVDLNATQAAIRAGYSSKTAAEIGAENLRKPQIAAAIAAQQAKISEKTEIDATWVLLKAVELHAHCIAEPIWRDGEIQLDAEGNPRTRVNTQGVSKALELIGKHIGVQAFQDKAVLDLNHSYAEMSSDEIQIRIADKLTAAAGRVVTKH